MPVAQYCDEISVRYRDVFRAAHIEQDDFIRTTEERHKQAVAHFWVSPIDTLRPAVQFSFPSLARRTLCSRVATSIRLPTAAGIAYQMRPF